MNLFELLQNLTNIYPDYYASLTDDHVTKMATRKIQRLHHHWKSHATLDLFWYEENSTHIILPVGEYYIRKKFIFPLTERPLHGLLVPAPRDPRQALADSYAGSIWQSDMSMCHLYLQPPLPCLALTGVFPVVRHSRCVSHGVPVHKQMNESKKNTDDDALLDKPMDTSNKTIHVCKEELIHHNRVVSVFYRVVDDVPVC